MILEIVMTLVAAIMADEIAQVAVADVAADVAEVVVVIAAAVVVVAVVAVVATVAVVVAEAEMVDVVAIVAVNVMVVVTADVTAAEVAVTDQTIRKVVVDRITKENHVTPTHDLTEVIVQKGKKSHSKGDQRSAAEVIEAVELAIVEQTTQYILTPMLRDRSI